MCLHFLVDVCALCYETGREEDEKGRGKKLPPVAVRQKLSFFFFICPMAEYHSSCFCGRHCGH